MKPQAGTKVSAASASVAAKPSAALPVFAIILLWSEIMDTKDLIALAADISRKNREDRRRRSCRIARLSLLRD